jgi:sigma-E factor negative regulatory protein RseC
MNDKIKHIGTIKSIEGNHIQVKIVQTSACSTCAVASHCNAAESKEKVIDIYNVEDSSAYKSGEEVTVWTSGEVGMNAVLLAFGVPFIIFIVFLYVSFRIWNDEFTAALVGIGAMMVYYFALYFWRRQLGYKFAFHIEK